MYSNIFLTIVGRLLIMVLNKMSRVSYNLFISRKYRNVKKVIDIYYYVLKMDSQRLANCC